MPDVPFSVPHDLPRDEAAARLLAGVPKLQSKLPPGGSVAARQVGENGMILEIAMMGQTITVESMLSDAAVAGQVKIPAMMALMKSQIVGMVEDSVARMLSKPV